MWQKIILLTAALALVSAIAMPAFADTATDAKTWFEQKFHAKKEAVNQAVEDGRITAEQGRQMNEHFDQMYKFHEENGFICPYGNQGMMGAGRGNGPFNNQGQGYRGGFGGQGMNGAGFGMMQFGNINQSK